MAREQLDVTVMIFNNRSYAILNMELARVGAQSTGPKAKEQLDLTRPNVDFVQIGNAFGVPSRRADTAEELIAAMRQALGEPGPHLIEMVVPSMFTPMQLRAMPYALKALGKLPRPLAAAVKRRIYP
jgi:acetolactate synthase-1/2/3 large subunit